MPSRHDRIAIIATKHGVEHSSEIPEQNGRYNYYRILSWNIGLLSTHNSLAPHEGESTNLKPEGELLPAPLPKPEGGYY